MHRQQSRLPETQYGWWRFDRYEIQDAVIRPVAGSRLIWYDPWASFQQVRNQTNGQPAYSELARLVTALKADVKKNGIGQVSQESQSKILAWCGRHGLLGVLLSRWERLTLAPRADVRDPTLRIQERYFQGYGNSNPVFKTTGDLQPARPGVLIHSLNDVNIEEESFADTWYRFFPSVPERERETFQYPFPYSEQFCKLYAEPLFEFWRAARLFAGIVEHIGPRVIPEGARDAREALARQQTIETLNLLRRKVSQVLVDGSGGLRQQWVSPSLLASFAEMFVVDLVAGRRAQYCECCGYSFITEAYQAHYCTPACRLRQQKRNLRSRIKSARALYLKGQTIHQISKSLGADLKMVQGWVAGLKRGRKAGTF